MAMVFDQRLTLGLSELGIPFANGRIVSRDQSPIFLEECKVADWPAMAAKSWDFLARFHVPDQNVLAKCEGNGLAVVRERHRFVSPVRIPGSDLVAPEFLAGDQIPDDQALPAYESG